MSKGTSEHGYACLPGLSHMVQELNSDAINTITYNAANGSFMYCFITFGSCIRGYYHILKKLKSIVFDEPELWIIFDRNASIDNGFPKAYRLDYHEIFMRNHGENLQKNFQYMDYL
ncbi:hypothetical protein P3S67_011024 [Capsicum chacoense]